MPNHANQTFGRGIRRGRRRRVALVVLLPAILLAGCGIFGGKKGTLPVVSSAAPRSDARMIAKQHRGLPPDLKNARHTQDELRGDQPALPALTPITTPQTVEGKPK